MANTPLTITALDAILMLSVEGVFPTPVQIQEFMTDAASAFDAATTAEVILGVDGKMSAGLLPRLRQQTISIMPGGSLSFFETWRDVQDNDLTLYYANGSLEIPGIKRKYIMTNGVLMSEPVAPAVKKVVQGVEFKITWESVAVVNI